MTYYGLAEHLEDHGLRVEGDETLLELSEAHAWAHADDVAGAEIRRLRGGA